MRNDESSYGLLNLLALPDSLLVEFEGDDGIFIPFRSNPSMHVSDRGVYLFVKIHPLKRGADLHGNTHAVFATAKLDVLDAMTEEDRKLFCPYLGKLYPSSKAEPGTVEPDEVKSGARVAKRITKPVKYNNPQNEDEFKDFPF